MKVKASDVNQKLVEKRANFINLAGMQFYQGLGKTLKRLYRRRILRRKRMQAVEIAVEKWCAKERIVTAREGEEVNYKTSSLQYL